MALVVMRLVDMHRVHPLQDNSHVCSKCGERVGIYPSGQKALRGNPAMLIICAVCTEKEADVRGDVAEPAAPISEILQEIRDSRDVGKA